LIRFGLFGCGRIGRVHADSIDVHPRAELAWVYDPIESVVLRGADGALCHITNSRRSVFGYDQRLEAFGSAGMLSIGNQHQTSVRLSNATQTEAAREYFNFFLDRYTPAYRAELDHLITAMEQGSQPSPGFADGPRGAGTGRCCARKPPH
jgi:predicted dehydrogenase